MAGRRIDRAETDAAIIGSEHHAFSRFGIRAIADGARQIFAHQRKAHAGETVDHRMGLAVGEGFNAMGHGIHPRCRRNG
ncbi:hypothetical protein D3C72_2323860 [compost metagenome]